MFVFFFKESGFLLQLEGSCKFHDILREKVSIICQVFEILFENLILSVNLIKDFSDVFMISATRYFQ